MALRILLLLAGFSMGALAAPMTPEKLQLIPNLYPKERRELAQKLQPFMGKSESVEGVLVLAGVNDVVAKRINTLSPGPLLVERYAHGLVLEAPDLTERQKELLNHIHPSVLASQWAIFTHKGRALRELKESQDDAARQRLTQSFDRQIRDIEKRYWRMVSFILTVDQRAAIHKYMPQQYQRPPNLQQHLYQLPGLSTSQASRLRSLFVEWESESAADSAEIRRLQARTRDQSLPIEERREAQRTAAAAQDRVSEIVAGIVKRGRAILTPEQYKHVNALPPLLTPQDRAQNPGEIIKQMGLPPEKRQQIQQLAEKAQRRIQEASAKAQEKLRKMNKEVGTDSPQAMTMQMMQQGVRAEQLLALEEAAHDACMNILDKRGILGWIISPR